MLNFVVPRSFFFICIYIYIYIYIYTHTYKYKSIVSPCQYDGSALDEANRKLAVWERWSAFRGNKI